MDLNNDQRIFVSLKKYPCDICKKETPFIIFGIHKFVCSEQCLSQIIADLIVKYKLVDWVRPII